MSRKREIINFLLEQLELVDGEAHEDYTFKSNFKGKVRRGSGFAPKLVDDIEIHLSVPGENRLYGPISHGILNTSIIIMSRDNNTRTTIDNAIEDIKHVIYADATFAKRHLYGITTLKIADIIFTPIGVTSIGVTEIKLELVYELTR